ncbi:phytanoyl-CoA dioxygenase family protein [Paenibacillus sp. MMS18-CY102]|uniref:phytanoyl-CoA dioxygenase family protein n=1 Tax=Paenibacillus sp. MMS18-CY102 TaxID=2682849 RepID=UPI00136630BF|nr:phytanoyl-CoA dioxygenase family protein [Paenibacillus sp. MMS18-CY102]MWC29877.1 phytanoyl-CoA dioxygenase [Paenibacillus sp. MMS18-CY102]
MQTTVGRFSQELEQLHRDGYVVFRNVLDKKQVADVKAGIQHAFEGKGDNVMLQGPMFEKGEIFEYLVDQPTVIDFIEEILGTDCQLSSMNGMRTVKNTGVSMWHVDEALFFPLPDGVEIDPSIQMPVYLVNALYYLDDITEELGPTQVVPGSHRAGKHLQFTEEIEPYKGQEPVSVLAKAGDCLIFNSQIWHRGAPNQSDNPRYVQQIIYRKKFIVPHMSHDNNAVYQVPEHIAQRANARRRRLMGYNEQIF